jgi:hypothetical protein
MKIFALELSQELRGTYIGTLEIKANTRKEAIEKLGRMSNTEIDEAVEWDHADEYYGELNTIQLIKTTEI